MPTNEHLAYIGVGSNLGNRAAYLRAAVEALTALSCGRIRYSSVYESDAVEQTDQPDYLNMVVEVSVQLRPFELLTELNWIEQQNGRIRTVRFGPRTLDLDILFFDDEYVCFQALQIPHPRLWERSFTLVPLAELSPDRRGLGGRTIAEIAEERTGRGIRYVGPVW